MENRRKLLFVVTLAGLSAFGPFVTDMYLPALPVLPEAFSTSPLAVQMSMSVCMFGLALGQIFIGPLSDKFGRRMPLLLSMLLFVVATFCCVLASDIYFFIAMRFFQGIAGAGGIVLSRSISSDKYSGMDLARFLALIAAVHSIAPVAAPIVGGLTLTFMDWRGIFIFLFILGIFLLLMSCSIEESLEKSRRSALSIFSVFKLYKNVFLDKVAFMYIVQQAAMSIILFAYISASPFIFEGIYGLNPVQFGGIFAANAIAIGVGAVLSAKFRRRRRAVVFGAFGALAGVIVESILICGGAGAASMEIVLLATMLMYGLAVPAAAAIVLDSQHKNAGTASALLGALPFFLGSLAAPCTGLGNIKTAFSGIIIFGGILSALLAMVARHYQKKYGPTTAS